MAVNSAANRNLIAEASRAGVRRFVYVAAHVADGYRSTAYLRAHEMVVESLHPMPFSGGTTIVRPTGIFSALHDILTMARRGFGVVIGDGSARTNPIHPADVAELCFRGNARAAPQTQV